MSRTFLVNGLTFHFEDGEKSDVVFKIMSSRVNITASINPAQADAIGNVFKAVAKTRGFKEKNTT